MKGTIPILIFHRGTKIGQPQTNFHKMEAPIIAQLPYSCSKYLWGRIWEVQQDQTPGPRGWSPAPGRAPSGIKPNKSIFWLKKNKGGFQRKDSDSIPKLVHNPTGGRGSKKGRTQWTKPFSFTYPYPALQIRPHIVIRKSQSQQQGLVLSPIPSGHYPTRFKADCKRIDARQQTCGRRRENPRPKPKLSLLLCSPAGWQGKKEILISEI